jgi:NhaP-type Na+/H+ or K+/H+ antiporter
MFVNNDTWLRAFPNVFAPAMTHPFNSFNVDASVARHLLLLHVCTLLGLDNILAVFACGTTFAWDGFFNRQMAESVFLSVVDLLFNVAVFMFVGLWMLYKDFVNPELMLEVWRLVVISILILLLCCLPTMITLYHIRKTGRLWLVLPQDQTRAKPEPTRPNKTKKMTRAPEDHFLSNQRWSRMYFLA